MTVTSRYVHAADAVLLAAADAVADRTLELMDESKAEWRTVVPLRAAGEQMTGQPPKSRMTVAEAVLWIAFGETSGDGY